MDRQGTASRYVEAPLDVVFGGKVTDLAASWTGLTPRRSNRTGPAPASLRVGPPAPHRGEQGARRSSARPHDPRSDAPESPTALVELCEAAARRSDR